MQFTKTLLLLFLLLLSQKALAQFNPEPESITERYFSDKLLNDWKINTPAFSKKSGFTSYKEMMAFLQQKLNLKKDNISMEMIGKSQKGKDIPMIVISNPKIKEKKVRIWIQGGLHGDEPAGTESLLYLISQFSENSDLDYLLNRIEIAVVPMANIDGYQIQKRESANGKDLNRDQTSLRAPETIALKKAWTRFAPEVSLDLHEYRAYRKDFTRFGRAGITSRYDVMFLFSGNLNVPDSIRNYTRLGFVEPAQRFLRNDTLHYKVQDYLTTQKYGGKVEFNLGSVHARSSASNWALGNCFSTLLEIRGVGLGRKSYRRRVMAGWKVALSYLNSAYSNPMKIKMLLAATHQDTKPVVVLSERKTREDSLLVIDLDNENEVQIPITIHDALQSYPILERERPKAYILAKSEKKAAEKLRLLGVQVDSISSSIEAEVESYQVPGWGNQADDEDDNQDEEDSKSVSKGNSILKSGFKTFTAGTYVIYLNQDKGNLVCELLEPENPNGFLAVKVIRFSGNSRNSEYPVYRSMKAISIK